MKPDWMHEAAEQIAEIDGHLCTFHEHVDAVVQIIREHCPLKPDVAYMPVPRCETCAYWKRLKTATIFPPSNSGTCDVPQKFANVSCTDKDFGCVKWQVKQCSFIFPILIDDVEHRCLLSEGHSGNHEWKMKS